jgi:hypothetical protein
MDVTPSEIVKELKEEHSRNALSPIEATPLPMITEVIAVQD